MNYKVGISNSTDHFVRISAWISNPSKNNFKLQLPAWRPGRYELANYAKNIRCFEAFDENGIAVSFKKVNKDLWEIFAIGNSKIQVSYEYYANQPDAGASFAGEQFLYLNPVNCFMYVENRMDEPFEITLDIPANWQIACQLKHQEKTLLAPHFDALADSPFFASPNLVHHSFKLNQTNIHFWFEGGTTNNMAQLEADTRAYAQAQLNIFGELPLNDYHFLYLLTSEKFRHGVEHADSTVIAMGPAADMDNPDFYNDFLAISSHELFHLWNIKRIRPTDMLPYNFTKENYSELGYIYEGITTYYGDLMLFRSGVWNFEQYAASLANDFNRHYNNAGRFNYSVAQSSFDTWLDGYVPGVKGRKVSIYMEGLIAALVADIKILEATAGKASLDDVLKQLYEETFKKGMGYNKALYQDLLENVSGESFHRYFSDLIDGKGLWDEYIINCLKVVGLELIVDFDEVGIAHSIVKKISNPNASQNSYFDLWSKNR